jgi:hypothetical protein
MELDETFGPVDERLLGPEREALDASGVADLIQQLDGLAFVRPLRGKRRVRRQRLLTCASTASPAYRVCVHTFLAGESRKTLVNRRKRGRRRYFQEGFYPINGSAYR